MADNDGDAAATAAAAAPSTAAAVAGDNDGGAIPLPAAVEAAAADAAPAAAGVSNVGTVHSACATKQTPTGPVIREVVRAAAADPAPVLATEDVLFLTKGLANFSDSTGARIDPDETARIEKSVAEGLVHAGLGDAFDKTTLRLVVSNATLPLSGKNATRLRRICKTADVGSREWRTARALGVVNEHVKMQGNKRNVNKLTATKEVVKDVTEDQLRTPIVQAGESSAKQAKQAPVIGRRNNGPSVIGRRNNGPAVKNEPTPDKVWQERRQHDRRTARAHPYFTAPAVKPDLKPDPMGKLKDYYTEQLARRMARMAARSVADESSSSSSSSAQPDETGSGSSSSGSEQAQPQAQTQMQPQIQPQMQPQMQPHQRQHNPYNHYQPYGGVPVFNPYMYSMGYPYMAAQPAAVPREKRHGKRCRDEAPASKPADVTAAPVPPKDEDDVVERRRPSQPEPKVPPTMLDDFSAHFLGNANIAAKRP